MFPAAIAKFENVSIEYFSSLLVLEAFAGEFDQYSVYLYLHIY